MINKLVYYDIDETLVYSRKAKRGELTPLGSFLVEAKSKINIFTLGLWSKEMLTEMGFNIDTFIGIKEAYQNGLIENRDGNVSKKLPDNCILVDDNDHPATKNVIKVAF